MSHRHSIRDDGLHHHKIFETLLGVARHLREGLLPLSIVAFKLGSTFNCGVIRIQFKIVTDRNLIRMKCGINWIRSAMPLAVVVRFGNAYRDTLEEIRK